MSEWDEDRAELVQRIRYLTKLSQQGKKWAVSEMIVELKRLLGWYADRRKFKCSDTDRIPAQPHDRARDRVG